MSKIYTAEGTFESEPPKKKRAKANPLAGLRLVSFDEIARQAISGLHTIKLDLADPDDRLVLEEAISESLRLQLDLDFMNKLLAVCQKGFRYVLAEMNDETGMAKKVEARRRYAAKRRAKNVEEFEATEALVRREGFELIAPPGKPGMSGKP